MAAAGYYGGPRALEKAKQNVPLKDPRNPSAPNTLEYSSSVANNAGLTGVAGLSNAELLAAQKKASEDVATSVRPLDAFATNAKTGMEHLVSSVPGTEMSNEMEARLAGPEALARYNKYKDLTWPSKLVLGAGTEAQKLIAGTKAAAIPLGGYLHYVWTEEHPALFPKGAQAKGLRDTGIAMADLAEEQKKQDMLYKEFHQTSGIPGAIGGALPYVLSGNFAGPALDKVMGKMAELPLETGKYAANEGRGLLTQAVEGMANLQRGNNPITNAAQSAGQRVKFNTTDPLNAWSAGRKLQVNTAPKLTEGAGKVLGSAALGALEGGLHYDNTMEGGALSSVLSTLTGNKIGKYLTTSRDWREGNPYQKELLKWYHSVGGSPTPGTKFGDIEQQQFEAGMRNSARFGQRMHIRDEDKKTVDNNAVWTALGVPRDKLPATMTPNFLADHVSNLKKGYEDLESSTVGQFDPTDMGVFTTHLKSYAADKTRAGKALYSDLLDYRKRLYPLMQPSGNMSVTGSQFKDLRARLKADIDSAYTAQTNRGDALAEANALKLPLKLIDDAVERGIQQGHGTAGVNAWKDLNTKYAFSNDVMKYGSDKFGNFDPQKWGEHQMASDPQRFLTERQPVVGGNPGQMGPIPAPLLTLNRLAKLKAMENDNAGSSLEGMNIHGKDLTPKEGIFTKMIMPRNSLQRNAFDNLYFNANMNAWPKHYGLLGMSGKSFGDPALYTRALGEQRQEWPKQVENVKQLAAKVGNKYNKLKDTYIPKGLLDALE